MTTDLSVHIVASDGEPRIRDAELAARLEYSDVSELRKLIRRNVRYLKKINNLVDAPVIHAGAANAVSLQHSK